MTGIAMVRLIDQATRDRNRRTYRLSFPSELKAENVTAWMRSISGTMKTTSWRLAGSPTVAFELWATAEGIQHRIKVPWQYADYVVPQLRQQGLRVAPEEDFPEHNWTTAVEVGMSNRGRQLRIYEPADTAASLLASVQALQGTKEALLVQIVVTPTVPRHLPQHKETPTDRASVHAALGNTMANRDEIEDRRAKLEEPNFLVVMRLAATAETKVRAEHLIYQVRHALTAHRSAAVRFTKRVATKPQLYDRIKRSAGAFTYGMQLNAQELAALVAWPINNPNISGLPPYLSRHLPASEVIPREGRVLGTSNFPGAERPVALGFEESRKHVHVLGPTGVGKSVLLANMMRQDMAAGYGVVLIENKGDLFRSALDYVPPERLGDVIVMDVTDRHWPVGFNVLGQGDPRVAVDEICNLFEYLYRESRSVWTREALYYGLQTLLHTPGMTFVDLAALLLPRGDEVAWADNLRRRASAKDRDVGRFWQRFENQPPTAQDRFVQPVLDRIWQLIGRPEIRNMIGQSQSGFQLSDVLAQHKILLINLENLPKDTASLAGTLIMNSLWHAVKSTRVDRPNFLYLDEFQDFINLPVNPEDMLAKARGFGLGMTLAHQHLAQLPPDMRGAILSNARSKVVFQTTADDARVMVREFGAHLEPEDFMHLGKYEALARVATGEGIAAPFSFASAAPAPGTGMSRDIVKWSRQRYGRPLEQVEAELENRHRLDEGEKQRQRPKIGGWG
jgi:hypothetical protein